MKYACEEVDRRVSSSGRGSEGEPDAFSVDAQASIVSIQEKLVSVSEAKCTFGVARHRHCQGKTGNKRFAVEGVCVHTAGVACQGPHVCVSRECQHKVLLHSGGVQLIAETAW